MYALSHVDTSVTMTFATNTNAISRAGSSLYVLGNFNSTGDSTTLIYKINPVTGAIITQASLSGIHHGLSCDNSFCYTVFGTNIIRKISQSSLTAVSASQALSSTVDGQSLDAQGGLIAYTRFNGGALAIAFMQTSDMTETALYSNTMGATGVKDLKYIPSKNRVAVTTDGHVFWLFNTLTANSVCSLSANGNYVSAGQIKYDSNLDRYFVTSDTANRINVISNACALSTTITGFGEANFSVGVEIDTSRSEIYVLTSSASTSKIVALAYANFAKKWEYLSVGTSQRDYLAYDSSNKIIMVGSNSNLIRFITLDAINTQAQVCIDTNLDGITDLCFKDTNNDGVADNGVAGSLGAFQSNANVTDMGTQWFCAFNLGDACNNSNQKTNGVGLFFTGFLLIISYSLLVGIHIMAQKQLNKGNVVVMDALKINPLLLLIMIVVVVGFTWYLKWIEDVIFYTTLVVMIGLGGFGIYRAIKSDSN